MANLLTSLRFRTAFAYILLIVAAFAALGFYLLQKVETDFRASIEEDLASQAAMLQNVLAPVLAAETPQAELDRLAADLAAGTETRITVIAPDGTVLADSQADPATMKNHLERPELREALASGRGADERLSVTVGRELTYVALPVSDGGTLLGFVRVAHPSASVQASLSDITRSIFIAVAVTAGLAAALSLLVTGSTLRPLARLAAAAKTMAAGRLDERITPRPPGEVGELAEAFNQMGESLQELIAAASQERSRMLAALNSSSDAVLAVDDEARVRFANAAAERLFSRPQQQVVGNPVVWLMPDRKVLEALRASSEGGRRQSVILDRPNQSLQVFAAPIVNGGDWVSLLVFHDVTEVRRVEQMRRDFIANVSHELRTPLASIKSVIETLQDGALGDPAVAEDFLSRADQEVDRLARMVEELLEISRIESGQVPLARRPVNIADPVERAVERLRPQAEKQGVALMLEVERTLSPVSGDAERLERAVVNLVHNGIKFTPAGGSIRVSAAQSNGSVLVRVSDTGDGIAPEDLPRVFERFYKADRARGRGGAGLGLAVVKHTVEAHGGTISVESRHGEGATFTISLPALADR